MGGTDNSDKAKVAEAVADALVQNVSVEDAKKAAEEVLKVNKDVAAADVKLTAGTAIVQTKAEIEEARLKGEFPAVPPVSAGTNPDAAAGAESGGNAPVTPAQTPSSKEWSVSGLVDSIIAGAVSFGDSISGFLKNAVSSISKWLGIKGDAAGDAAKKAAEKVVDGVERLFKKTNGFQAPKTFNGADLTGTVNVTSPFGQRVNSETGELEGHGGIDLDLPEGCPIYATEDCEVISSGFGSRGGNAVTIKLQNGYENLFCHFQKPGAKVGPLKAGDIIGYIGHTGRCRSSNGGLGTHLHFEVHDTNKHKVDPRPYLSDEIS
ncbi:MAG: M23 family metallopeptidase [Candidatus Gracilibacteria bacterium]